MDILTEIFLFLDQVQQVRLVSREYNQAILQTPFFKRDYFVSGTYLEWLHFPEIHIGIFKYNLMEYLSKYPKLFQPIFILACQMGKLDFINWLLQDPGVDPNDNDAFQSACENGHLDVVNRLLQDPRVDPNDNDALRLACENGHLDVVNRLLQDSRVDPSIHILTIIMDANKKGHYAIVNLLLKSLS